MSVAVRVLVVPVTADVAIAAQSYIGHNFCNTGGTKRTITVYDGTDSSGCVLDRIVLRADESCSQMYAIPIPLATGSIFVDWSTNIEGSVRVLTH